MKLAILGDSHFGVRSDSNNFHEYYRKFYQECFFPYLREHGITQVIQTGDLFDRRKFVNFVSLKHCREYFFDEFTKGDLSLITYLGNHDITYKNTLSVNSPELLLRDYIDKGFIKVITKPTKLDEFDIIPWICAENEKEIKTFISNTTNHVCFGHFEINGFSMERGSVCHEGMNREDLDIYDMVISGHFHHKSSDGHIFYVGAPCEHTWADYDDEKGFHIFDTVTKDLSFVRNPFTMFKKVYYDDSTPEKSVESVNINYSEYANSYVKVVVSNKLDHSQFDDVISKLYENHPIDVGIVEDFTEYNTLDDLMAEEGIDQSADTPAILDRHIDNIDISLDKNKLKYRMRETYNQAQNMESV